MRVALQVVLLSAALRSLAAFAPSLPHLRTRIHSGSLSPLASSLEVDISNIANNTEPITNGSAQSTTDDSLPEKMLQLPTHPHTGVNDILLETEHLIRSMHTHSKKVDVKNPQPSLPKKEGGAHDAIFANTYVDLGKVATVGFGKSEKIYPASASMKTHTHQ
jgi:hypothetical protein